tara:strand:- start:133 stop:654 length:522 start_codon:yes stop_codon:yes gene_type:complete
MKEVFKDIPNYEGLYQISNLGRLKSLDRVTIRKNKIPISIKGRFIICFLDKVGYYRVSLSKYGKYKKYRLHQLVAMAFLNHKPNGYKMIVDHIDNNKLNNELSNLQLISHRENCSKDKKGGSSIFIGVHWCKNRKKWISNIRINGCKKNLGSFDSEYDAHLAYQSKLKEILSL